MINYVEISVEPSLLPHIARDLLAMASDPDHVRASTGEFGPVLLVHPQLADVWYKKVANEEVEDSATSEPEVVEASADEQPAEPPAAELPVTEESTKAPEFVPAPAPPPAPIVASGEVEHSTTRPVVANEEVQDSTTSDPEVQLPVKRGPGRPRKVTSASPSEVL